MINLFASLPPALPTEFVEVLHAAETVRIERIVSQGQASPADFWYNQDEHEWVALLSGSARLRIENEVVELKPGDCLFIPAHQRHRVEWTAADVSTVWLAVFYK